VFRLDHFALEDTYRLAAELRDIGTSAATGDEAANLVVSCLFDRLRTTGADAPACKLVRLFRTTPWSALPEAGREALRPRLEREPEPETRCLVLRASRGVVEEWNDPGASRAHHILPISSAYGAPMMSALVAQLGLSTDAPFILKTEDRLCNVFHVEQAAGSPFVPDQAEFVQRYGIQSVLGFGGLLTHNELFAVILFCAIPVARETAYLFRLVAPSVGLALVASRRDPGAVEHRLRTTQELLRHHERIALAHIEQQREVTKRLARSEAQERAHTHELEDAVRRLEAHHAVTCALAESATMSDAIPRILAALGQALGCNLAYAWRPEPSGEKLELVGAWPLPIPAQYADFNRLTRATVFAPEVGLPGRVWASATPAWLVEIVDDPNFPRVRAARAVGLHTGVAFPAILNGEVVCVIEMFSRESRARDEDILRVLVCIGGQIGQFVARIRAREEIRLNEIRNAAILQAALDCIVSMNASGVITEFNPGAERTFGYRREDVVGKDMASLLIPPSLRASHHRGLARYLTSGVPRILGRRVELSAQRADGTVFPVELALTRMDVPGGPMFTAFIRDTTDRKQAAEERDRAADALRASEYRFRTLTRQAPVGIMTMDKDGRCNFVNERWSTMTGMSDEHSFEHGWHEAVHPDDRQSVLAAFYDAVTSGAEFSAQYRLRTRGGAVLWVQEAALPLRTSSGELCGYLRTLTDVTERMQSERIARFLADATSALSSSLDYEVTLDAVAKLAVPALADCCTVHVAEGGALRLVAVSHVDPNAAAMAHELAHWYGNESDGAGAVPRSLLAMRPELISEVTEDLLPRVALSPAHAAILRAMIVRSYVAAPLVARGRTLGAIHLMMGKSERTFGPADLPFVEDLGRRAASAVENARLYREAQEAARAREEFLAIASHELKTPLTALQLAVQQLLGAPLTDTGIRPSVPSLQRIERSTKRLISLADDLLDVTSGRAARVHLDLEEADLSQVVGEVVAGMQDVISRSGSEVCVAASGCTVGRWDRRRLDQVVTNLLSNALKFGAKRPIAVTVDGTAEGSVRLRVCDHGIGIPFDDQSRIFERFQRAVAHRQYGGFGLGLWLVRQLVEAHGGTVGVTSEPGSGSTFTVDLPRSGPGLAAPAAHVAQ
jgi:PAS domain S-box-containing protein